MARDSKDSISNSSETDDTPESKKNPELNKLIKTVHKEIGKVWRDMEAKIALKVKDGLPIPEKMEIAADIFEVLFMVVKNVKKEL